MPKVRVNDIMMNYEQQGAASRCFSSHSRGRQRMLRPPGWGIFQALHVHLDRPAWRR